VAFVSRFVQLFAVDDGRRSEFFGGASAEDLDGFEEHLDDVFVAVLTGGFIGDDVQEKEVHCGSLSSEKLDVHCKW
jgi:hypothetical protein